MKQREMHFNAAEGLMGEGNGDGDDTDITISQYDDGGMSVTLGPTGAEYRFTITPAKLAELGALIDDILGDEVTP